MNKNKIQFIENETFEKYINIDLCNDVINFILKTSENSNKISSGKLQRCIWIKNKEELKNISNIKYFGELLERYEEKIGKDIRNIRAISLALGYAEEYITDNMIIGTQLVDFINKIEKMANDDIYLQGALFLYDNKKFCQYGNQLLSRKYANTEEIIFALSLFEDIETTFYSLKEQLIHLIGKGKTISAINNIKMYAWIINKLYNIIKKDRKKDSALLKALITIPTKQIKENDIAYQTLNKNEYLKEEIAYLNYAILHYVNIPKTVRIGNSITEERIAIELCKTILNDYKEHNQSMYELIKMMLEKYNRFDIKCEGNERLKDALKNKVSINNPRTFLEFYDILDRNIFQFDILNSKWDLLAEKMQVNEYRKLFDDFIRFNDFNKEKIENSIEKYNELTKSSYLDTFFIFQYYREDLFQKLVNKDILSLRTFYETYNNKIERQNKDIEHLKKYVSEVQNKNAFSFLKYILEDKKLNIEETDKFGFDLKCLYQNGSYYRGDAICIKKDFLNKEEKCKVFCWLENYIFKVQPNHYMEFLKDLLYSNNVKDVIDNIQLRELYIELSKVDAKIEKDSVLREQYLTQEELKNIISKEEKEKEQEIMRKLAETEEKIKSDFENITNKNFKTLEEFCYNYKWGEKEEWMSCSKVVKDYLYENIDKFEVNETEIAKLMDLFLTFIHKKSMSAEEFKQYIIKYLMKGEINYGTIKKAC